MDQPNPVSTKSKPTKSRPTETLPTDRISFSKQLNLLIAYAALYEQSGQAVSNEQVGEVVGLSAGTASLANAFFADVGFVSRSEGGYVPSPEVIAYRRVQEWNPEHATQELAPLLTGTWFAQVLLPKLALGPLTEQSALTELSKRANASTQYRPQLSMLIDYLVAGGLISQDGDQLRRVAARRKADTADVNVRDDEGKRERDRERQRESGLHPFVQGLLQELPPAGSHWSKTDQEAWIEGWRVAFRFLYKTEGDSAEVPFTLTPAGTEASTDEVT